MSEFDALEDASLISLCQLQLPHDQRAFTCLVARHQPALYRFVLQQTGDSSVAEDITQDAFMQVYHHINNFEGRSSFRTWLFSIARNAALSHQRSNFRYQKRLDDYELEFGEEATQDNHEINQELEWLLARLTPEQREILSLRYLVGFELSEIAVTLEIKLSAAKMRLYRATEAAREIMEQANEPRNSN